MSDIVFTREVWSEAIGDSSLVDEVYYNENTGDLYVDLDPTVYKYSNVPVEVVEAFEKSGSAGEFYNTEIKRKFGPGENLGSWLGLDYEEVEKKPVFAQGGLVTAPTPSMINDSLVVNVPAQRLGTPVPHFTLDKSGNLFSLKPFTESKVEGVEREYVVTFEVEGMVDFKRHTLKSTSVDEAVQSVLSLGKMLDLTFIVREVTIRFE